jgi:hypothetical protein
MSSIVVDEDKYNYFENKTNRKCLKKRNNF